MGKSRSVTVVVAYLLRQNPHHTVSSALSLIRVSRPIAEPNDGFMAQLELYKSMGCPRNLEKQSKYQRWLYQKEVDMALAVGIAPDNVRFEDEHTQEAEDSGARDVELRCRKCRRTLATTPYLINHLPIPPKVSPSSQNTGPISSLMSTLPPAALHTACTHHFLHPLSWMRSELEQGFLGGRLECPNSKCSAQLGRYAWQGMRCSCGVWVCPAFSLQKGRVDEVVTKGNIKGLGKDGFRIAEVGDGDGGGIRLPPGMNGRGNL